MHVYNGTYVHTYMHACTHTYIHMYIRMYVYTYIYTYLSGGPACTAARCGLARSSALSSAHRLIHYKTEAKWPCSSNQRTHSTQHAGQPQSTPQDTAQDTPHSPENRNTTQDTPGHTPGLRFGCGLKHADPARPSSAQPPAQPGPAKLRTRVQLPAGPLIIDLVM